MHWTTCNIDLFCVQSLWCRVRILCWVMSWKELEHICVMHTPEITICNYVRKDGWLTPLHIYFTTWTPINFIYIRYRSIYVPTLFRACAVTIIQTRHGYKLTPYVTRPMNIPELDVLRINHYTSFTVDFLQ